MLRLQSTKIKLIDSLRYPFGKNNRFYNVESYQVDHAKLLKQQQWQVNFRKLHTRCILSNPSNAMTRHLYQQEFNTDEEKRIYNKLHDKLSPTLLKIHDISGGCGSMYSINIISDRFNGLTTIKQHKLVNQILKDDISKWHGIQLTTKKPTAKA